MRLIPNIIAPVAGLFSLGVFTIAAAAPVSISNITASWENISPASGIAVTNNNTATPSMRWGSPVTSLGQSGYDFVAAADTTVNAPPDQSFTLGSFTHRNNPITNTSLSAATLSVTTDITVDGLAQGSRTFNFDFTHTETPNGANPCANGGPNNSGVNVNGCADLVTVSEGAFSEDFLINGVLYKIAVVGFKVGDDVVSTFETIERKINTAQLIATVTTVSEVPLPGAVVLMLSGLFGLGFASRKKKLA